MCSRSAKHPLSPCRISKVRRITETASVSVTEAKSEHEASVVVEISKGKLIVTNYHLAEGQRERIKEEAEYSETETDVNKTNHQIFCLVQ